ncbi:hypothetical protein SUGI_0822650 [Cryptomeria japonica]|uniref:guard cell S-type anion channel SLAC1 n=1 Tax=Cryptomeria japonica TaxID=3369 RepID=UPI002414C640|nr:guard cell S-type anion channel SLAC1 [Cryptomeria japonica]GLJ40142.1 hypothetical protein SUGI_0822650 [Cryptomeria japonica]
MATASSSTATMTMAEILQITIPLSLTSPISTLSKPKRKLASEINPSQEEIGIWSGKSIKWVLLHEFDIENYRICLAVCSQALLWKTLGESSSLSSWRIREPIQVGVWCLALATLITVSLIYGLKCIFYVGAVKEEYFHRVRVNYFFAPMISCMLLTLAVPPVIAKTVSPLLCCLFVTPVILLEVRLYGKWFTGGKRVLAKNANPSQYLSVVGNFVGAMLAARVGWKEPANFMFAVGFAHYAVLFVTLYQRLPTNLGLPTKMNPTFFLFLLGPSTASLAWEAISGSFGIGSKMPYFLSLFLFAAMVVRINFISGSEFSLAWWAYVFPVTAVAIATMKYSDAVKSPLFAIIAFIFFFFAIGTLALLVVTSLVYLVLQQRRNRRNHCNPCKKRKIRL